MKHAGNRKEEQKIRSDVTHKLFLARREGTEEWDIVVRAECWDEIFLYFYIRESEADEARPRFWRGGAIIPVSCEAWSLRRDPPGSFQGKVSYEVWHQRQAGGEYRPK